MEYYGPHALCATEPGLPIDDNNCMHVAYRPGFYKKWGIEVSDSAK